MATNCCCIAKLDKFLIDLIVVSPQKYTVRHIKDTLMLSMNETVTVTFTGTHLCMLWPVHWKDFEECPQPAGTSDATLLGRSR